MDVKHNFVRFEIAIATGQNNDIFTYHPYQDYIKKTVLPK